MFQDFRLKVFVAVADQRSFTKAAELLKVSQPAVSQNISELEKGLGFKLFERLRGEVSLTSQGEVFMRYALAMLDHAARTEVLFEKLGPASVRLCVSDDIYTYYIKGPLEQFCAVHPEITFERVSPEEDPDLTVVLAPAALSPFETVPDAIARVRISMSPSQKKLGDFYATQEKISYYDLLFKPSQTFASAKTCPVLKDYLASLL